MIERLLLVSTCGTSLLTNGASDTDRRWLTQVANEVDVDPVRLTAIVDARREALRTADTRAQRKMSAELNGIGAVLDRYRPRHCVHLLVHTDTAQGKATANLVQSVLGEHTLLVSAGGLRTNSLVSFRAALADVTRLLDESVRGYREHGWFVVFNLTGGFKSLNGYLQTLGMITADRCVFLFEGAAELMEIPRLPVRLAELEELRENLTTFRRLAVGYAVHADAANGTSGALFMEVDGQVTTSVLGDVAWARHRSTLFSETLLTPLSSKVRVTDPVTRVFAGLETSQKLEVNEALDEFCAYIDHGRALPKSRTFKKLQGNPVPGCTHELYAWSDGATGRLFGHHEADGTFVFDLLKGHL